MDYGAVDGGVMAMRRVAPGSVGVVLTVYRRTTLETQLKAVLGQTHAPAEVVVWQNGRHVDISGVADRFADNENVSFVRSTRNFKFHGRFAVALMMDTEYVLVLDDDQIPGRRFVETGIRASREQNALVAGVGRMVTPTGLWGCSWCADAGYSMEDTEVDIGGHAWLLRTEWLQYYWSTRMPSWDNGEDIDLSASLKLLAGIRTIVPRMPPSDSSTWCDVNGGALGGDSVATHKKKDHGAIRHNITNYWIQLGWRTVNNITGIRVSTSWAPRALLAVALVWVLSAAYYLSSDAPAPTAPPAPIADAPPAQQPQQKSHQLQPQQPGQDGEPPQRRPQEPLPEGCAVFAPGRDYERQPVVVVMGQLRNGRDEMPWEHCDVPCVLATPRSRRAAAYYDARVDKIPGSSGVAGPKKCPRHQKDVVFSMESVVNYGILDPAEARKKGYDMVASYDLDSDVPLPYYSWAEYDVMAKPSPKTAGAMMAVIISNCGAHNNRLEYIKELQNNGVTVHSFGRCLHNKDFPSANDGGHYVNSKNELIKHYKFTAAMENSNCKNYVTEKLFGPFVAGSVPIHMGIKNVHEFSPSNHATISVHDFASPKELAKYLLYLDKNETAYNEYLSWKTEGPSQVFREKMDLSLVHSSCRLCIRVADLHSREVGPEARPARYRMPADWAGDGSLLPLYVRERGKFWTRPVALRERTLAALQREAVEALRDGREAAKLVVTSVYGRFERDRRVQSDADVEALERMAELEVVLVDEPWVPPKITRVP
eukprot:m51a1_g5849 hypothetical protein (766) ;mRNA; r:327797-331385